MQSSLSGVGQSRVATIGAFALVAIAVLAGPLYLYGPGFAIHHDLAGMAQTGQFALTLGDRFGDYSLYFPPAERIWFSFVAQLSQTTGISLSRMIALLTSIAILISTTLAYSIRRKSVGTSLTFFVVPALLLVILPILFKNVFGLREHFVALGLWPYLVLRLSDPEGAKVGRSIRIIVGFWLGATLLFKYLCSIVVLLIELLDAAMKKRPLSLFRIENLIAGGIVAAYLFVWLILNPEQRAAMGAVVSAIDANLADAKTNWLTALYRFPPAIYFLAAARVFKWPLRETLYGLVLVVGAMIVAAVQSRWYTHHVFPITLAYIVWWWLMARSMQWWGHLAVAILIVLQVVPQYRQIDTYQQDVRELRVAIENADLSVAGKRIGVLAVHPSPYNQYLTSHDAQRWNAGPNNSYVAAELQYFDTRENADLTIPAVKLEDPGRRMLHEEMLKLWEDMPPDALLFDHTRSWPLRHVDIDWMQAFAEDERFQAIMAQYEPVLVHKGERLEFTYYVRKGD